MARTFDPWIGPKYHREGLGGLRLHILGESHYGTPGTEHSGFTQTVVRDWGQKKRKSFFTITTKVILGIGASPISNEERADFWDRVAFSNFVQCFVAKGPGTRPTDRMWAAAREPLLETLQVTEPHALLVLGKEMYHRLPVLPKSLPVHAIRHPSRYFRYADWQPGVQRFLREVQASL